MTPIQKLIDAAKSLLRETRRIKKNVKRDFSLMNAEAHLDKVVLEVESTEAAPEGELVRRVLEQLEWSRWDEGHQTCPVCQQATKYGHADWCDLKKILYPSVALDATANAGSTAADGPLAAPSTLQTP